MHFRKINSMCGEKSDRGRASGSVATYRRVNFVRYTMPIIDEKVVSIGFSTIIVTFLSKQHPQFWTIPWGFGI